MKEFIKLNVNTMIKDVKLEGSHTKYATVFVKKQTLKMI